MLSLRSGHKYRIYGNFAKHLSPLAKRTREVQEDKAGIHDILLHSTAIHFLQEENVNPQLTSVPALSRLKPLAFFLLVLRAAKPNAWNY